ncbi:MAG: hypothetical protein IKM94_01400 [Alphaproteobacteria bacterium]|nr:hypothetical protein [Alphaproteobacteria bacterium]
MYYADTQLLNTLDGITKNAAKACYTGNSVYEKLSFYDGYYADYDADGYEIWDDPDWYDDVSHEFKITKTLATINKTKDKGVRLVINEQPVEMTPWIIQKCEQLLYEYKLRNNPAKEKAVPNYNKIIKQEQSRDVYQNLPQFKKEKFFTQQDTPELFIKNMKVKPLNWFARKAIGFANADKSAHRITTMYRENNKWYIHYPCKATSLCGDIIKEWHRDLPIEFNSVAGAFYMAKAAGFKRIDCLNKTR